MLKKVIVAAGIAMGILFAAETANAQQYVRGHYRSSGTYVQPHYRSYSDGNFYNNWSTYPNINPYTGRVGTLHYPSFNSYRPSYGGYSWGR